MPKRLTYKYIKSYIETNSNGQCKLLSKEYVNNTTPLQLKCKCGNIFERKFNKLSLGRFCCKECSNQKNRERFAFTLNKVKKTIKEKRM